MLLLAFPPRPSPPPRYRLTGLPSLAHDTRQKAIGTTDHDASQAEERLQRFSIVDMKYLQGKDAPLPKAAQRVLLQISLPGSALRGGWNIYNGFFDTLFSRLLTYDCVEKRVFECRDPLVGSICVTAHAYDSEVRCDCPISYVRKYTVHVCRELWLESNGLCRLSEDVNRNLKRDLLLSEVYSLFCMCCPVIYLPAVVTDVEGDTFISKLDLGRTSCFESTEDVLGLYVKTTMLNHDQPICDTDALLSEWEPYSAELDYTNRGYLTCDAFRLMYVAEHVSTLLNRRSYVPAFDNATFDTRIAVLHQLFRSNLAHVVDIELMQSMRLLCLDTTSVSCVDDYPGTTLLRPQVVQSSLVPLERFFTKFPDDVQSFKSAIDAVCKLVGQECQIALSQSSQVMRDYGRSAGRRNLYERVNNIGQQILEKSSAGSFGGLKNVQLIAKLFVEHVLVPSFYCEMKTLSSVPGLRSAAEIIDAQEIIRRFVPLTDEVAAEESVAQSIISMSSNTEIAVATYEECQACRAPPEPEYHPPEEEASREEEGTDPANVSVSRVVVSQSPVCSLSPTPHRDAPCVGSTTLETLAR